MNCRKSMFDNIYQTISPNYWFMRISRKALWKPHCRAFWKNISCFSLFHIPTAYRGRWKKTGSTMQRSLAADGSWFGKPECCDLCNSTSMRIVVSWWPQVLEDNVLRHLIMCTTKLWSTKTASVTPCLIYINTFYCVVHLLFGWTESRAKEMNFEDWILLLFLQYKILVCSRATVCLCKSNNLSTTILVQNKDLCKLLLRNGHSAWIPICLVSKIAFYWHWGGKTKKPRDKHKMIYQMNDCNSCFLFLW